MTFQAAASAQYDQSFVQMSFTPIRVSFDSQKSGYNPPDGELHQCMMFSSGAIRIPVTIKAVLSKYIRAVSKYWWVVLVGWLLGIVDLAERILGTWWLPTAWTKWAAGIVGLVTAQFLAYRDLQRENDDQQTEIERLQTRPYDLEHRRLAEGKVRNFPHTEKDLLRFLLHHGRTEQSQLQKQCQDHPAVFSTALGNVERAGLILRNEVPRPGRASIDLYWQINPTFEAVLRDLLFPSDNTGSPKFVF